MAPAASVEPPAVSPPDAVVSPTSTTAPTEPAVESGPSDETIFAEVIPRLLGWEALPVPDRLAVKTGLTRLELTIKSKLRAEPGGIRIDYVILEQRWSESLERIVAALSNPEHPSRLGAPPLGRGQATVSLELRG